MGLGFKLVLFFFGCTMEGGILVPRPGWNLSFLCWEHRVLITGQPEKSLSSFLGWRNGHKEVQ